MTKKKQILFVCHGNSIRSVMAEAIFNNLCKKNYKAKSAGTLPISRIDPNAKKVLKEKEIKLTKKKPSSLDYEKLNNAEKIIKMNKHLPNFPSMVPEEKIIEWNIKEVVGQPIEDFRKTRDEITKKIKEFIKELD